MSKQQQASQTDDQLNQLMKSVGARPEPAAEIRDAVYGAVQAEFETLKSRRRLQPLWLGSIAAVLVAAVIAVLVWPTSIQVVATLAYSTEPLTVLRGGESVTVTIGDPILVDDVVAPPNPLVLATADAIDIRVDGGSELRFEDVGQLELKRGAVYIDSGAGPAGSRPSNLTVLADGIAIAHIGTQYLVEHRHAGSVRVSVREGAVRIAGVDDAVNAGESATMRGRALTEKHVVSATDERWAWAAEAAPPLSLNGMSLAEFCRWFEKQTGRHVQYLRAGDSSKAEAVELSGSTDGLTPDAALEAVLLTAQFEIVNRTPDTITLHYREQ